MAEPAHNMEALLAKAGLDAEFVVALDQCGACIAGSAALWAMRMVFGIVDAWEPNDIDVWLPYASTDPWHAITGLRGVLDRSGFVYDKNVWFGDRSYAYGGVHKTIAHIFTFAHPTRGIAVQTILVRGLTIAGVAGRFDISVCKVVWTPTLGFGPTAEDVVLDARSSRAVLSRGEVYDLGTQFEVQKKVERTRKRIVKYAQRGFDIVGEREALLPVLVRWRLIEWSRRDHAYFPEEFRGRVAALLECAWVSGKPPRFAVDAIAKHMWELEA